jgi:ribosomal protein L3
LDEKGGNDMAQKSHPKRGSRGYWPRKRIHSLRPHFNAWPEVGTDRAPRLQGFAGYKAGMTHAVVRDSNKNSTTADQEIQAPVTVLEVPPMRVAAIRFYTGSSYGLKTLTEVWADKLEKNLGRLLTVDEGKYGKAEEYKGGKGHGGEGGKAMEGAKEGGKAEGGKAEGGEGGGEGKGEKGKKKGEKGDKKHGEQSSTISGAKIPGLDISAVEEVRVLVHTLPHLITGVPKKVPDMMEIRIGGGNVQQRTDYALSLLGKEIKVTEFAEEGLIVDVAGVTKGHGFSGTIKKWHPKLLTHKNSKHRRMIGTLGPHFPSYVQRTVPQAGQCGLHQRTEFNKRILKMGDKGEDVTPAGGFMGYGAVRNGYVLIAGSVPGAAKRLIKLRDAVRFQGPAVEKTEVLYISKESKQGS